MKDYGRKYSGTMAPRQKTAGRHSGRIMDGGPSRVVGAVAIAAMLLGVISSLWFGMAIRDSLGRLDSGREEKLRLATANVALRVEKESLFAQDNFAAAASKLGLFPPSENQLRKP